MNAKSASTSDLSTITDNGTYAIYMTPCEDSKQLGYQWGILHVIRSTYENKWSIIQMFCTNTGNLFVRARNQIELGGNFSVWKKIS